MKNWKPPSLSFLKTYLGIEHSEEIVYVQITAGKGRTFDQKKKLYASIAEGISTSTEILANNIIIILTENDGRENWSFGNGKTQEPTHL